MFACNNCEYESKKFFGVCPRCREGVGFEKETISVSGKAYETLQVSKNQKHDTVIKNTVFPLFNKILSTGGGFVEDQVISLGAAPGTGKSTLCTQIADEETLYIGTEESYAQINSRFLRVNPDSKADIFSCSDLDSILQAIEKTNKKLIILDSLNSINQGMDGYLKQSHNMFKIVAAIKAFKKIGIIIMQVTKDGKTISGMQSMLHAVDSVLHLDRSLTDEKVILYSSKNRFAEIGSLAMYSHTATGLEELSDIETFEPSIGSTFTKGKFGYRSLNIIIEALCAPSSLSFGLRKTTGINLSRVQQILGIIQYNNGGINFINKDVYVSIASGIFINDSSLDLAIANSILSSYFKKISVFSDILNGEIALNGAIRHSSCPDIKHINDLIRMYK